MTEVRSTEPAGLVARGIAHRATGLLAVFNRAGVLEAADVHVADRLGALAGEADQDVLLAVALAVRGARLGAVCVNLDTIAAQPLELDDPVPWPEVGPWVAKVAGSPLVAGIAIAGQPDRPPGTVLHLVEDPDGRLLYLDRHWREEDQVLRDLLQRLGQRAPEVDVPLLGASLDRLFPEEKYAEQKVASRKAAEQWTTILTGGPGTGKTASVARMLVLLAEQFAARDARGKPRAPRIALAAPTGKASARLGESVAYAAQLLEPADRAHLDGLRATTLHRLLGWRPDSGTRFKHHRTNPLPYDVIVVDEVSMVSLSQMARLFEAVRDDTRLILVGDPNQLASVEAGAVLKDLVEGFDELPAEKSPVAKLTVNHRIAQDPDAEEGDLHPLDELAQSLRDGDNAESVERAVALLTDGAVAQVRLVDPLGPAMDDVREELVQAASTVTELALDYDEATSGPRLFAALDRHRLLCAHRVGPWGVAGWNQQIEQLLVDRDEILRREEWYAGRQVLVTSNDRGLGISNGDIGVVVQMPDRRLRVALRVENVVRLFAPTRVTGLETVFAMTVHKSQGSEAESVTVVLPADGSRLLTRELLYTAVTRAKDEVTIIGTEDALRAAIALKVQRASGLRSRLATALGR
ncbi:exodeoxyribonuclease V alpha subunit [Marmoricola sp. OAE513]|uniref:exodeoxyribonuclease V subunit alpha n=1 Tax=Marmoricola sp. OAE513 TaxID=2817894 RepID=UPI001AE504E3